MTHAAGYDITTSKRYGNSLYATSELPEDLSQSRRLERPSSLLPLALRHCVPNNEDVMSNNTINNTINNNGPDIVLSRQQLTASSVT